MSSRGRKTKYKAEFPAVAARLAAIGMIDSQIAEALEVDYATFKRWLSRYDALRKAMAIPKAVADDVMEHSVYRLGQDRWVTEEEIKVIDGKIVRVNVQRFVPGNVTAALAWLNNRRRDTWRRNPDLVEDAAPPEIPQQLDITPENARQMARKVALLVFKGGKL